MWCECADKRVPAAYMHRKQQSETLASSPKGTWLFGASRYGSIELYWYHLHELNHTILNVIDETSEASARPYALTTGSFQIAFLTMRRRVRRSWYDNLSKERSAEAFESTDAEAKTTSLLMRCGNSHRCRNSKGADQTDWWTDGVWSRAGFNGE